MNYMMQENQFSSQCFSIVDDKIKIVKSGGPPAAARGSSQSTRIISYVPYYFHEDALVFEGKKDREYRLFLQDGKMFCRFGCNQNYATNQTFEIELIPLRGSPIL